MDKHSGLMATPMKTSITDIPVFVVNKPDRPDKDERTAAERRSFHRKAQ